MQDRKQQAAQEVPLLTGPTGEFSGELRLPVVLEARDRHRLIDFKNEDRTLRDLGFFWH